MFSALWCPVPPLGAAPGPGQARLEWDGLHALQLHTVNLAAQLAPISKQVEEQVRRGRGRGGGRVFVRV